MEVISQVSGNLSKDLATGWDVSLASNQVASIIRGNQVLPAIVFFFMPCPCQRSSAFAYSFGWKHKIATPALQLLLLSPVD
jgi:hypothetical protein